MPRIRLLGSRASLVASLLAFGLMPACAPAAQQAAPGDLVDLEGTPAAFVPRFNSGAGRRRFVAVLSPT